VRSGSALLLALAVFVSGACPSRCVASEDASSAVSARTSQRVNTRLAGLYLPDDSPLGEGRSAGADDPTYVAPGSGGSTHVVSDKKHPMVALLLSAVLPGLGEFYTGHPTRAKWFMAAEGAIWLGYGAYQIQGNMREDDYQEFAMIFAGVEKGASSQYYDDIEDYIRSQGDRSYNQMIRREARSLFPDDLDAQEKYLKKNGYFGDLAWDWESDDRFGEYRKLRHSAAVSYRNAFYMTGLAVLNRAMSAIDSAWMARRHNQRNAGEPSARFSVSPEFSDGVWGSRATLEIVF
jgi:hypothetical protein